MKTDIDGNTINTNCVLWGSKAAQKLSVGKITKKTSTDSLIYCILTYLKFQNLRAESEGYINSKKDAAEATGQLVAYWVTVQKIW